jgi:membrane protein insertase Oxa1/YidC/SpoIIIJ
MQQLLENIEYWWSNKVVNFWVRMLILPLASLAEQTFDLVL